MKVKIRQDKEIEITEKEFKSYEDIRESGLTNMFNISAVIELSGDVLNKDKIKAIIENYDKLAKAYPDVRKQELELDEEDKD